MDGMSVSEQAQLFANAEAVVGVHGAALTNLVFAAPGTRVVEIFPPGVARGELLRRGNAFGAGVLLRRRRAGREQECRLRGRHRQDDEALRCLLHLRASDADESVVRRPPSAGRTARSAERLARDRSRPHPPRPRRRVPRLRPGLSGARAVQLAAPARLSLEARVVPPSELGTIRRPRRDHGRCPRLARARATRRRNAGSRDPEQRPRAPCEPESSWQEAKAGRLELSWKYPLYYGGWRLREVAQVAAVRGRRASLDRRRANVRDERAACRPCPDHGRPARHQARLPRARAGHPRVSSRRAGAPVLRSATGTPARAPRRSSRSRSSSCARGSPFDLLIAGSGLPEQEVLRSVLPRRRCSRHGGPTLLERRARRPPGRP